MPKLYLKSSKKIRGIVIWDFDHVLFDTERFRKDAEHIFKGFGISSVVFSQAIQRIKKEKGNFSIALVMKKIRRNNVLVAEKKIRRAIHDCLILKKYLDQDADKALHRLRRRGLVHMILSTGAAAYQHQKIRVGCGEKFRRHFIKILTTRKPKFVSLKKIVEKYPSLPIFFVDDTKETIALVKKFVPAVVAIHYSRGWSLKKVERTILAYLRRKHVQAQRK